MQIDMLLKIAGVGLLVAVISQVLSKAGREDIAMLSTVAGMLVVLYMVLSMAQELLLQVQAVFLIP